MTTDERLEVLLQDARTAFTVIIKQASEEEREACAQVAEDLADECPDSCCEHGPLCAQCRLCEVIAARIRERKP